MHSPLSMQAAAHLRDAAGPSPVRTMSRMPLIMSLELASATAAGFKLGPASKDLPHRVQASSISSTRAPSAVSKEISLIGYRSGLDEQTTRRLDIGPRSI